MRLKNRPVFTDVYEDLDSFRPEANSVYVFGRSSEERSEHSDTWEQRCHDVVFVQIIEQTENHLKYRMAGVEKMARLRSGVELREFWRAFGRPKAYLDITGLDHQVWAPLMKSGMSIGLQLRGVYLEPETYRFSPLPREGDIFDLSEKIRGLSPLPGFASLAEADNEEDVSFVALLGFEGIRLKYCVEAMEPPRGKIIPVIGVPGFKAEYPFYTYDGNRPILDETGAWANAQFTRANCPFSVFYLLQDIASMHARDIIKIALIGTKPHALGAVLFSLLTPRSVELIYDHPIRKASRTEGIGRVLLYDLSAVAAPVGSNA
ncbi:hypothetical protein [Granulicella sp. S156]|uniref:hypothetical protein n=1 Tax=Granulicella sp. S156 TaxID=1747224 RepID=UPI00352AC1DD